MKSKHKIYILIIFLIALIGSIITYVVFTKEDSTTTLTLIEKQWIQNNKSKLIDLSILTDIPILNYSGEGIVFDFLNDLEDTTSLEFNKVAYTISDEPKTEYAIRLVSKKDNNDILLYRDNYALLTNKHIKYNNLKDIKNITVGVLSTDLELVNLYLKDTEVTFKTYEDIASMIEDIDVSADEGVGELDAIILPKLSHLKNIVVSTNLNIAYNITELTQDYVLTLGSTDKLNVILKKYYKKWAEENYEESYNNNFTNHYFAFLQSDDKDKVEFRSKRYIYGFINNKPYDAIISSKLVGINNAFIKEFSKISDAEIVFKEYGNIESLLADFNANKIDMFFNNIKVTTYDMDVYNTVSVIDEEAVIISNINNNNIINSLSSLKGTSIKVLKDSSISEILKASNIEIKGYNDIQNLTKDINKDDIIALDRNTYNYYYGALFEDFKIDYTLDIPDYTYTIRDINANEVFYNLFNFYLTFTIEKTSVNSGYYDLVKADTEPIIIDVILTICVILVCSLAVFLIKFKPNKKKKKLGLSKEDKLKYVDILTSLKNRNYLNDKIDVWDTSEIYPQTIIIVDLNSIAYINDNYGHAEGDNIIKAAANILIKNQMLNSEIIRTNGNEFLIYLALYDEKEAINYIKKLSKEFKELNHGFGAAIGYSVINDAIKTVDDAINEATLDMRKNKEELK